MGCGQKMDYDGIPIMSIVSYTAIGAGTLALFYRYKVCQPNEFLVKTGLLIPNMHVGRKTFQYPFQRVTTVCMNPNTYSFNLHNMSREKVEFSLPVVFTVAPCDPDNNMELFKQYATMMNAMSEAEIQTTIGGIIEGEARTLTASLTVEEMFGDKERFRNDVIKKLEKG